MLMKNFPSFINENSSQEEVRYYLKSISKNEKVKKPQFHAVISTKFQQHNKEELAKVAEDFMQEMGYGNQPFIVVFHNDTENNHVHIVSTRVDKSTGKKLNDSYEKLKAQKSLIEIKERIYGKNNEDIINKLLSYNISSLKQLEILMEKNGFKLVNNKNNEPLVVHNIWSVRLKNSSGEKYRHIIGKATITTLEPGKEMQDFDEDNNILKKVTGIVIL